jgi:hypothetical protein
MASFWAKFIAGALFTAAAALTAAWPDWIEAVTGLNPDNSDGGLEWAIVASLGVTAFIFLAMSWRDFRIIRWAND